MELSHGGGENAGEPEVDDDDDAETGDDAETVDDKHAQRGVAGKEGDDEQEFDDVVKEEADGNFTEECDETMPGRILKNAFLLLFDVDEFLFGFKEFGFQVTPAFLRFGHVRAVRVVVLKIFFLAYSL